MLTADRLHQFRRFLLRWYSLYGRHDLPWRQTTDAYAILVSELMLQQTQVERVKPKYQAFLARFPDLASLAAVELIDVLRLWQGLGYNRRAKFLWQLSRQIVASAAQVVPSRLSQKAALPQTEAELLQLPGIGPYTAAAVCAFAYNQPVVLIETNVRTVFLYHFFPQQTSVSDAELLPLISQALDQTNSRAWYSALMDYGSYLKSVLPNPSRQSKHHNKASQFVGSARQVRGEIIRVLTTQTVPLTKADLLAQLKSNSEHHQIALEQLITEGLVRQQGDMILIG